MVKLPQKLSLPLMQTQWSQAIDPVISNPIVNGIQLTNIPLNTGDNFINHRLSRKLNGYIITGMHGIYAQIYDVPSQMPTLTLVLNSSTSTVVDIYVY